VLVCSCLCHFANGSLDCEFVISLRIELKLEQSEMVKLRMGLSLELKSRLWILGGVKCCLFC
jgi:hypothetical protein